MKINKDFAVKVEGKIFKTDEMTKISIEGWRVNIVCSYSSGTVVTVNARVKECEFLEVPQIPKLAQGEVIGRDRANEYRSRVGDEPASDIEIVSPLGTMRRAVDEAIKEVGNTPKTIQVGLNINGEQFAKAIKPCDSIRDSRPETMIAAFDKVGAATKELNETFNTLRNSIDALNRVATEALKKHDNTGGD